jgi:predicted transcriptional regulator of viral defense system
VPTQALNTPRGAVLVSTPEATALDLVGYQHHAGGLDQVATVLSELAERIDPEKLAAAAATAPVPWAQRLGYLLEHVGAGQKTVTLKAYVRAHAREATALAPNAARAKATRDEGWKLYVNAQVAPDL